LARWLAGAVCTWLQCVLRICCCRSFVYWINYQSCR
jgi:hypothetical protein